MQAADEGQKNLHPLIEQQSLWLRNGEETPLVLCTESWGNEIPLASRKDYLLVFEGPEGQCPEVQWEKDRITVYGWSGSIAALYLDGQVILDCAQRVPKIPSPT